MKIDLTYLYSKMQVKIGLLQPRPRRAKDCHTAAVESISKTLQQVSLHVTTSGVNGPRGARSVLALEIRIANQSLGQCPEAHLAGKEEIQVCDASRGSNCPEPLQKLSLHLSPHITVSHSLTTQPISIAAGSGTCCDDSMTC